jgi:hypothetical protein
LAFHFLFYDGRAEYGVARFVSIIILPCGRDLSSDFIMRLFLRENKAGSPGIFLPLLRVSGENASGNPAITSAATTSACQ